MGKLFTARYETQNKPFHIASKPEKDDIGADEIDQLWLLYTKNPTDQLRNQLVERYRPLVRKQAERIWARLPDGIELDDLISVGNIGLISAIASYDMNRGVRFEAFCLPRIQGAMVDELRSMDWVPRMVRSKATKLNQAYKTLELQLGRKPNDSEVAAHLDITPEELHQLFAETHSVNITSLDKTWMDSDSSREVSELEIVADQRSEDPTKRLEKIDMIRAFTKGLTKTERLIVILYYYEEMTMREIGAALELSESRVSQMHTAIVERMKKMYQAQ